MAKGPPNADRRPLTERLRPTRLADMIGNERALADLARWADGWLGSKPPARRAAVLSGPPGVGKTTAALALAAERGWSVIEMNASDARNESAIEQVAGRASLTETLGTSGVYRSSRDGGRSLILLDEADCLTGRATESPAHRPTPVSLREFLRTRYGSVDSLATAWGLGKAGRPKAFEAWESVPASAGRAAWTRLAEAQSDLSDWKGASKPRDITDRGGLGAIVRLVRDSRQPVVLTVNDESPLTRYSQTFRASVARIRFAPVSDAQLRILLRRAIVRSDAVVPAATLDAILKRAHGDARAALNDLDALLPLASEPGAGSFLVARDSRSEFEGLVEEVFREPRVYRSVEVQNRLDATPDDLLPWIEENLPRYAADPRHRERAFEMLGRAELCLARARRQRVWGLWSYASEIMTGGVGIACSEGAAPGGSGAYFPGFLMDMGRTRVSRAQRTALSHRVGRALHLSKRKANEVVLPWLERFLEVRGTDPASAARARRVVAGLELTAEDLGLLLGVDPTSPTVTGLLGGPPEDDRSAEEDAEAEVRTSEGLTPPPAAPRQRRMGDF